VSVYQKAKGQTFHFDFWINGYRFTGNTGAANRREALRIEQVERKKAKETTTARELAERLFTLEYACGRYWSEVGQYHSGADTTLRNLIRLQDFFGKSKPIATIDDEDVARLVAWRRSHTVKDRATYVGADGKIRPAPRISAATVNRSTIDPLQRILSRARTTWRVPLPVEPTWSRHLLKEPAERVREIRPFEESAFAAAIPASIAPVVAFARASGLRLAECLLRKDQVDFLGGRISTVGKGGKPISIPITTEMRAILMTAIANPTDFVFTYAAARAYRPDAAGPTIGANRAGRKIAKGEALPITPSFVKTAWRRARAASKGALPADFRFHDLRHDFATKLLRETGNLKLVQRALNHSKIETTTRYAHVLDDEVLAGMEKASKRRKGFS